MSFYHQYLRSPEWQSVRAQKLTQAKHACECCPATQRLQVHHLTYVRLGAEELNDLMVLCAECHTLTHGLWRLPPTNICPDHMRKCVRHFLLYVAKPNPFRDCKKKRANRNHALNKLPPKIRVAYKAAKVAFLAKRQFLPATTTNAQPPQTP